MRSQDLIKLSGEERIIAEETVGLSHGQMLLYPQKEIPEEIAELLKNRLKSLAEGRPLQYILGY